MKVTQQYHRAYHLFEKMVDAHGTTAKHWLVVLRLGLVMFESVRILHSSVCQPFLDEALNILATPQKWLSSRTVVRLGWLSSYEKSSDHDQCLWTNTLKTVSHDHELVGRRSHEKNSNRNNRISRSYGTVSYRVAKTETTTNGCRSAHPPTKMVVDNHIGVTPVFSRLLTLFTRTALHVTQQN